MSGRRHESIALPGGRRANDPDRPGPPIERDDTRIDVDQDDQLAYWAKELCVSREELRKAVQQAGPVVEDVRRYLTAQQAAQAVPAGRYLG